MLQTWSSASRLALSRSSRAQKTLTSQSLEPRQTPDPSDKVLSQAPINLAIPWCSSTAEAAGTLARPPRTLLLFALTAVLQRLGCTHRTPSKVRQARATSLPRRLCQPLQEVILLEAPQQQLVQRCLWQCANCRYQP